MASRHRVTPPKFLGIRMLQDPENEHRFWLRVQETGWKCVVVEYYDHTCWHLYAGDSSDPVMRGVSRGRRDAAAREAERWLLQRAELTLKLAGRRAA